MKNNSFDFISRIVTLTCLSILILSGCAVTNEEEPLITVSPGASVVTLGDTEEFSVSSSGTTVAWSVNGILGGNEGTVGKIDSDGIYTAPADEAKAPEKVSITASGVSSGAIAFLTTFKTNKRLTTHYTAGVFRADTYSTGQKNIAVYKDTGSGIVNVYAVWSDKSSGFYKVYFSESVDGGDTFNAPVPVDGTSSGEQISPAIAVDSNGDVHIVWEENSQGDSDILYRKYDASIPDFEPIEQINPDLTDVIDYNKSPSIAVSASEIYVTWERRSDASDDYPDIRFAWSSNLGSSFTPDQREISSPGRRSVVAMDPAGVAYVAWEDLTQFPSQPTSIKIGKISGGVPGATLNIDAESGYNARFPAIAVNSDPNCNTSGNMICEAYVVWQRAQISEPKFSGEIINSYDIDLAIVDGDTVSLLNTTLSVTDSGSSGFFGGRAYPAIAADNANIYLVWEDWRNGIQDIYFSKSSNGVDFSTNRIVNDDYGDSSSSLAWHEKPGIAVSGGKAYVVWTDYRNTQLSTTASPNDVYFAVEQ